MKRNWKFLKDNKYDNFTFESIWEKIDNGKIYLTSIEKKVNKKINTTTQSVKISNLRKKYGNDINLRKWLEDPNNVYVGRHGRIFIDKEIFHYPGSKWANPNKVTDKATEKDLEDNLILYRQHLEKEGLLTIENLSELKGKCLGCFCDTASTTSVNKIDCHTKVLYKEIEKLL